MNLNTPEPPSLGEQEPAADRAVLCSKCEHLNRWGVNTCKRCGSRLYVSCVSCGQTNERVRTRCLQCGRRLHRGLADKLVPGLPRKIKIDPAKVLAFALCLIAAYALIVFVGELGG